MEEVWKLAAEFQAVQLSTTKQKLSERNVVELVSKLVELRLIDVLYTSDGKTYLTHQQLAKEIKDELIVHGGRVSLVELQQLLNVDYSHVEAKVNELLKRDHHLTLVLGQLIDNSYRTRLAEEINDHLQEKGHVTIVDLTKSHDLPADFLRQVIEEHLGKKIKGQIDSYDKDIVFTDGFVARMKAQIRGALSAVTIPTTIGPIRNAIGCQEHLFHTILEGLISSGRLSGSLSGSRQDKSQFLPEIFSRAQNNWVDSFYKQNGYLEYDAISRLGIPDPKNFVKKRFKSEKLVFLSSCCVGPGISEQVDFSVDEALGTGGWVDITTVLPSILSRKDASDLLASCLKTRSGALVCDSVIVASEKLVSDCAPVFSDRMAEKAHKTVLSHPAILSPESHPGSGDKGHHGVKVAGLDDGSSAREDKKEQRRKKAASAGTTKKEGTGGREVKMKSTKKKGRGRDVDEGSDDDTTSSHHSSSQPSKGKQQDFKFMDVSEIAQVLRKQDNLAECPPELVAEIASKLQRPLHRQYQEVAKSIFLQTSGAERKKTAGEVQDKVTSLWTNIRLFEKGLKHFDESVQGQLTKHLLKTVCSNVLLSPESVQGQLTKHLLKTVCSDLANTIVATTASDNMVNLPTDTTEDQLTTKSRLRLISTLPKQVQEPLSKLHSTLSGQNLEDFLSQVDILCSPAHLGILLKKPDKRKERQLVFNHRQGLSEQLRQETDGAMCLHLSAVLLFQTATQCMLHAPGRLVPALLAFLATHMEVEKHATLLHMQDLVVRYAKLKAESEPDNDSQAQLSALGSEMAAMLDQVKEIALTTKKLASSQNTED